MARGGTPRPVQTPPTEAFEDVPASADGPFPYVVYAHGFAAYPSVSSGLTSHLASWGFVVASPALQASGVAAAG